jgi:nitrite reductase/ring-hydroxylating ferredoxin subunit
MVEPTWVTAGSLAELQKRGKLVLEHGDRRVLVIWHDDEPRALDDVCIHKDRELHKGVVLNGRIVCPGHQWAFDLTTGFCRERERYQPVYPAGWTATRSSWT